MAFLRGILSIIGGLVILLNVSFNAAAEPLADVVWRGDLTGEVIYSAKDPQANGLGLPYQLAIDPNNGEIYIGQRTQSGGNILVFDPATGQARSLDFFSQGLAFSNSGDTLYFGVSTLLLGAWFKKTDSFRKFAVIPSIRGVQVGADGTLYVAQSDFGPNGLYPDSVLRVNRANASFEPIFSLAEASAATGLSLNTVAGMGVDDAGNIYVNDNQGHQIIANTDGSFAIGNTRSITMSGLNEGNLGHSSDGLVYFYDSAVGEIFAYFSDGRRILLGYGEGLKAEQQSVAAIASDGTSLYFLNDSGELFKVYRSSHKALKPMLETNQGVGKIQGTAINPDNGNGIAGVRARLHSGEVSYSDSQGVFEFDVAAGLYEVTLEHPDYALQVLNLNLSTDQPLAFSVALISGLPSWLAPGLSAEIIANKLNDQVSGATDVAFDWAGNLYSVNHSADNITKTLLDPQTRAVVNTELFATNGNLANAWFVTFDGQANLYTSSSNAGVLKLPTDYLAELPWKLKVKANEPTLVLDQNGINRMDLLITDVDGAAALSNGDMILASGAGGSVIPSIPEGTFDSLVKRTANGSLSIFSRGLTANGTRIFDNPDIIKTDSNDDLLVSNRNGNLVRVNSNTGIATMIWPGNGVGKSESLGAYTAINDDGEGHLFIRGAAGLTAEQRLSMISPDGQSLIPLATGLKSDYGGFEFEQQGRVLYLSDYDFIIRIRSLDGRTIAENLQYPNLGAIPQPLNSEMPNRRHSSNIRLLDWTPSHIDENFHLYDDVNNNVPDGWAFAPDSTAPASTEPQNSQSAAGSSGGVLWQLYWLLLGLVYLRRQTQQR